MIYLILITLSIISIIFTLALLKAGSDADDMIEEFIKTENNKLNSQYKDIND